MKTITAIVADLRSQIINVFKTRPELFQVNTVGDSKTRGIALDTETRAQFVKPLKATDARNLSEKDRDAYKRLTATYRFYQDVANHADELDKIQSAYAANDKKKSA